LVHFSLNNNRRFFGFLLTGLKIQKKKAWNKKEKKLSEALLLENCMKKKVDVFFPIGVL